MRHARTCVKGRRVEEIVALHDIHLCWLADGLARSLVLGVCSGRATLHVRSYS